MVAFVAALVIGATGAFFNDTETSEANIFTAGAIDLKVDSEAHYNGMVCQLTDEGYIWVFPGGRDANLFKDNAPYLWGEPCDGTWDETDLGPRNQFFDFGDLKPGDHGENTLSLHVYDNDAYMCAIIDNMQDDDNGLTEPESDVDSTDGDGEGELSQEIHFFAWSDMSDETEVGNNIWEDGEPILFSNIEGPASDVIDGVVYPMFTPETQALEGDTTHYIGLYWCYGDIIVDEEANTLECSGVGGTNLTQTDSLSADISFYVEQARNNEEFECPVLEVPEPLWTDEGTRTGGAALFVEDDDRGTVLELTTIDDVDSRVRWINNSLDVDLSTLTGISYDSKQVSAFDAVNGNATMRLFVDLDGDVNTADVEEITFEPYYNIFAHNSLNAPAIVTGIWQTWAATLAEGKFWGNGGFLGTTPSGGAYATNVTLQQVLDAYPSAKIVAISLGMGTYNKDQVVLVDDLLINGLPLSLEN